jgi:hypothetical protein
MVPRSDIGMDGFTPGGGGGGGGALFDKCSYKDKNKTETNQDSEYDW